MSSVIGIGETSDGVRIIVVVETEHFVYAMGDDITLIIFEFAIPVGVIGGINRNTAISPGFTFFAFGRVDDVDDIAEDREIVADDAEATLTVGENISIKDAELGRAVHDIEDEFSEARAFDDVFISLFVIGEVG